MTESPTWKKAVDNSLVDHNTRLTLLEQHNAVYKALSEERRRHMNERFDRLETRVDVGLGDINSTMRRIVWLIISSLILAVIAWIGQGGLTVITP